MGRKERLLEVALGRLHDDSEVEPEAPTEYSEDELDHDDDCDDDLDVNHSGKAMHVDGAGSGAAISSPARPLGRISVPLGKAGLKCHVCGKSGHRAGFVGAVYVDCPNKPCYLCKLPGHSTQDCPHRCSLGGKPPPGGSGSSAGVERGGRGCCSPAQRLLLREQTGRSAGHGAGGGSASSSSTSGPLAAPRRTRYVLQAAMLKLHPRRVTALAAHASSDRHVISGDKKGGLAVWDFAAVHERSRHTGVHPLAQVNMVRAAGWLQGGYDCVTTSSDGTAKLFDSETGACSTVLQLNPGAWSEGCHWVMTYGADVSDELHVILAGDSEGRLHLIDPRDHNVCARGGDGSDAAAAAAGSAAAVQAHKPGTKVNWVAVHPAGGSRIVATAGNDHTARLFDLRRLGGKPASAAAGSSTGAAVVTDDHSNRANVAINQCGNAAPIAAPPPRGAAAAAAPARGGEDQQDEAVGGGRGRGPGRGRGRGRGRGGASSSSAAAAAAGAGGAAAGSAAAAAGAAQLAPALAVMQHGRVVNSASFSPSGRSLLTTCQDNRIRIWNNLLNCDGCPPCKEFVHSHDFNRYLSPFRAEWIPTDASEQRIVCGRYISEDYGGIALHPVDIMDVTTGALLSCLVDPNLTTICPVNMPHPRLDIIISGSSGSLYKWEPAPDESDEEQDEEWELASPDGRDRTATTRLLPPGASSFVCVDADAKKGNAGGRRKQGSAGSTKSGGRAGGGSGGGARRGRSGKRSRSGDALSDADDDN